MSTLPSSPHHQDIVFILLQDDLDKSLFHFEKEGFKPEYSICSLRTWCPASLAKLQLGLLLQRVEAPSLGRFHMVLSHQEHRRIEVWKLPPRFQRMYGNA
ncbi:hypothetical protein AAY473_003441 [Plecturocebus cupreus]